MADLNVETSEVVYQVFQAFFDKDTDNYGKDIERETGLSQGQVGDSLKALLDAELIEKGKRGQSQYYEINRAGIKKYVEDLWNQDFHNNLEDFLPIYVEEYTQKHEQVSTIGRMLGEDLMNGLRVWTDFRMEEDVPWAIDTVNKMEEEKEKDYYVDDFVATSMNSID